MAMTSFSFSTKFILDKAHFNECYIESNSIERNAATFLKAIVLSLFGLLLLLFSEINAYVAWFVVVLGIIEALNIYYHQPWWVLRQMMSKAYKSEVTLTIDDKGVLSESHYNTGRLLWSDINKFKMSDQGYVFYFDKSKHYLSKQQLSAQTQDFILVKLSEVEKLVHEN